VHADPSSPVPERRLPRRIIVARVGRTGKLTVLVTGAAGFIGSALVRRLRVDGHRVKGIDLPSVVAGRSEEGWLGHDLTTRLPPAALFGLDLVIHAAALAGVQPSWRSPARYERVNAHATELLRCSCEAAGVPRVIHLSSISVYGLGADHDESSTPSPVSPYGRSKLRGERAWSGYDDATIVRLSNVYGPGQRPDMAYATFLRAVLSGRPIELRDGGRQLRTPTYIDDCVDGILAAATFGRSGAIYNIAGDEHVRLSRVPRLLGRMLGRPVSIVSAPAAPGDPCIATVSNARAGRELSYAPRVSLPDGLERQLELALGSRPVAVTA
jgi:nucleoside-diphosphate-sugar epimerase